MSATEVVDQLLSLDSELKQTYQLLNQIRTAIQQRDWNNYNAAFWRPLNGSEELRNTIKTLQAHFLIYLCQIITSVPYNLVRYLSNLL